MAGETEAQVGEGSMSLARLAVGCGDGRSASPSTALWQVLGSLTPEQPLSLRREIEALETAVEAPRQVVRRRAGEGVRARHSQWCPSPTGGACICHPRREAWAEIAPPLLTLLLM
jgi:hypothetical protein